jgi:thiamine biosynthesis protein ThiS
VTLQVTVNGSPRECPDGSSVDDLLRTLGLPLDRVAVERNRAIVRRSERSGTPVEAGDVFEVVTFVGGG